MSPKLVEGLTYIKPEYHHLAKRPSSISNILPTLHGKGKIVSLPIPSTQFQPIEHSDCAAQKQHKT